MLSLALGALTLAVVSFALPPAAIRATGTPFNIGGWGIDPRAAPVDLWWAARGDGRVQWDVPRGGRYLRREHALLDRVDMRRILFAGVLEQQEFYDRNTPPAWAATISLDMREGFDQVITTAGGWPFRAFRGEHWISWREPAPPATPLIVLDGFKAVPAPVPPTERVVSLWHMHQTPAGVWSLPYEPMWAGLTGNLVVYAATWCVLLAGIGAARRAIRRRRGQCTRCAYDLGGLAPGAACPECGHTPVAAATS